LYDSSTKQAVPLIIHFDVVIW